MSNEIEKKYARAAQLVHRRHRSLVDSLVEYLLNHETGHAPSVGPIDDTLASYAHAIENLATLHRTLSRFADWEALRVASRPRVVQLVLKDDEDLSDTVNAWLDDNPEFELMTMSVVASDRHTTCILVCSVTALRA